MTGRRRLGVVLVVPSPASDEINGLRRALGDPSFGRIPPHLTLVPPVNVRSEQLGQALAVLRSAAARASPLWVTLGPVASFLPVNPVLYLQVTGDLDGLAALRNDVFVNPLQRPLTWPFSPHVTLVDGMEDTDRLGAAVEVLDGIELEVCFDRVHLLEERRVADEPGRRPVRRWIPIADAAFGPSAVVGRGGLELQLTRSTMLDPEARDLLMSAASAGEPASGAEPDGAFVRRSKAGVRSAFVLTARRETRPVGAGALWLDDSGAHISIVVNAFERRQGVGAHLLKGLESGFHQSTWKCTTLCAHGPAGFYLANSAISRPGEPPCPNPAMSVLLM